MQNSVLDSQADPHRAGQAHVVGQAVGRERRALGVGEGERPGLVAHRQVAPAARGTRPTRRGRPTRVAIRRRAAARRPPRRRSPAPRGPQHRLLAHHEGLQAEAAAQLVELALGLRRGRPPGSVSPAATASVIRSPSQWSTSSTDTAGRPGQPAEGLVGVAHHQVGEVRRAPVGRQAEGGPDLARRPPPATGRNRARPVSGRARGRSPRRAPRAPRRGWASRRDLLGERALGVRARAGGGLLAELVQRAAWSRARRGRCRRACRRSGPGSSAWPRRVSETPVSDETCSGRSKSTNFSTSHFGCQRA